MNRICSLILSFAFLLASSVAVFADITVRQRVTMSGQTFETTKMIKGARERTENKMGAGGAAAAMMSQVATITQCDLRRTVQLNDSKKLYFVEPFPEEDKAQTEKPAAAPPARATRRGGTLTMTFAVTDTGERKQMFGLTARHLIVVQEIESSPDSCGGARKSKMEIDAWYVDFSAEFSCPINVERAPRRADKPDCQDRVIVKQSGAGKTGFLLNGTMKFYDENGAVQMTQTTETLELSRAPLAAALFDVPPDYKSVASSQELYSMPNMADLMRQQQAENNDEDDEPNQNQAARADAGARTVGLNVNFAGGVKADQSEINQYLAAKLRARDFRTRQSAADGVDYVLSVEINKIKESTAGKVGGIFGKVTGVDPKAGKTEIEMTLTLTKPGSPAPVAQSRVAKRFDGSASEAVRAAIDEAMEKILAELEK